LAQFVAYVYKQSVSSHTNLQEAPLHTAPPTLHLFISPTN